MATFLYRRGNGNEGNFPRFLVDLKKTDSPYAALKALVANDYIAGRRVRRHIMREIEIDGEPEYGLHATVYEGPEGESDFGAAYLTAELQPVTADDLAHYEDRATSRYPLRRVLDNGALRLFRAESKRA